VRNIGSGFQIIGISILRVSSQSRVLFGMSDRHSLERVRITGFGEIFGLGVDVFISLSSNGGSGSVSFGSRSLRSLLDFNFFESHGGKVFVFTVTTFGVFFGFFEHEHSGEGESISVTFTTFELRSTGGVFTNEFTFRFGAFRFVAFPVTSRFFTDGFTFRFGDLTMSNTVGRFTDGNTFGTIFHFTSLIGTHDLTVRSFTFDITNGVFGFLARRVAFGGFTNGGTDGITSGIVTFP